jgi:hypothetical protein
MSTPLTPAPAPGVLAGATRARRGLPWGWLLALAVLAGSALRLLWVEDMEYKYDEAFMFERSQRVGVTEPWPAVGMPSGVGLRNPGMSVWLFVGLARVSGADDPVSLTRAVIVLNVLALFALALFVLRFVHRAEREPWWWTLALASVNPMAIQLQRKIWAQSALPMLSVVTLVGWWNRSRAWGAFLWGALGTLLGQIHMSGFFFFGGFTLWALLFDRAGVRWRAWGAGVALGALPMIPWVVHLLTTPGDGGAPSLEELYRFHFWGHWTGEAAAFHLGRSLGMDAFWHFLSLPVVGGRGTWLVGVVHVALFAAALAALSTGGRALWRMRGEWRALLAGRASETAFTQNAALWGFGILLTLAMMGVERHYLIVAFPLNTLWLVRMALAAPRTGRRVLLVFGCAQLLVSAAFLGYVHAYGGAPGGDYGVAFSRQLAPPDVR